MRIGDRSIGSEHPVFLYAEVGTSPMGDLKRAFALVDAAKVSKLDAIKFILTDPAQVECPEPDPFTYATVAGPRTRPIADLTRETLFTPDEWRQISDYCREQEIIFFATVDHIPGVALLESLNVPAYKICAWDIQYVELFDAAGATRKPVLFDVGTASETEFLLAAAAILRQYSMDEIVQGAHPPYLPLLSPHPTSAGDWYLGRVVPPSLSSPGWGFSSPGRDSWCDFVALGLGAVAIEKRLTLDRTELRGHHHWIALEPSEMEKWVRDIRKAEMALREDPWGGSEEAWAMRKRYDRTVRMPDGRRLRHGSSLKRGGDYGTT